MIEKLQSQGGKNIQNSHSPLANALRGKVLPMPAKLLKWILASSSFSVGSASGFSSEMSTMDTQSKSSLALTPVNFFSRPFSK